MGIKNKLESIYESVYDGARRVSAQRRRIKEYKHQSQADALSAEQIAQVKEFYKPYRRPSLVFHRFFTEKRDKFEVAYIPQDLYVGYIDPYFNDIRASKYVENKCYYGQLLSMIPQPFTILKRMNGIWMDGEGIPVSPEQFVAVLKAEADAVFVKEAQTTAGGAGVFCVDCRQSSGVNEVQRIAMEIPTDIVVQRKLIQHEDLARLNPSSVNTLRIYSVLGLDGNVTIYSSVLRMGVGNACVDNYSAGGITCGVQEDGSLRKFGYNKQGDKLTEHPGSKIPFEGYRVPCYEEALKLIRRAHPLLAHFRSVAWDIAITENGTASMIEANLCRGGIVSLQLNNGPLYGKDTIKILDEVFKRSKLKTQM